MRLPRLKPIRQKTSAVSVFGGLNRQPGAADGEFAELCGLTCDAYPALTVRPPRYALPGGVPDNSFICYLGGLVVLSPQESGYDKLFYEGQEIAAWREQGLSAFADVGDVSLISAASIGSFLLFAPYRAWFNVDTLECGSMTAGLQVGNGRPGNACVTALFDDGDQPSFITVGEDGTEPPASRATLNDNEVYVSSGRAWRWRVRKGAWDELETMTYRIELSGSDPIPAAVAEGNEVTLDGLTYLYYTDEPQAAVTRSQEGSGAQTSGGTVSRVSPVFTGKAKVKGVGSSLSVDWFDLGGIKVDCDILASMGRRYLDEARLDLPVVTFRILGGCPDLAFVCAAENRVWGCASNGREIFASALGDPRVWYAYGGSSADSWAGTVGDGSPWTGAVTFRGKPCFFKRDRLYCVNGARPSNFGWSVFSMQGTVAPGSPAVVSDRLYYLGADGVYAWAGGVAERVSDKLGGLLSAGVPAPEIAPGSAARAFACSFNGKYYLNAGERTLVYEPRRRVWHSESDGNWLCCAEAPDTVYYVRKKNGGAKICSFAPRTGAEPVAEDGWTLETGELMRGPGKRYLSRVELTMDLDSGAECTLYAAFDGGDWIPQKSWDSVSIGRGPAAVAPRRIGSFRLKLAGKGGFTLYALTLVTEEAVEHG